MSRDSTQIRAMQRSHAAVPDIPRSPSKAARLRALLASTGTEFIMEAHNGVSARIVEEAGFKGIWASSLAISAQFGALRSGTGS